MKKRKHDKCNIAPGISANVEMVKPNTQTNHSPPHFPLVSICSYSAVHPNHAGTTNRGQTGDDMPIALSNNCTFLHGDLLTKESSFGIHPRVQGLGGATQSIRREAPTCLNRYSKPQNLCAALQGWSCLCRHFICAGD